MSGGTLAIRLRALGDIVLTTPALRALKRGAPDAPLEVVCDARYAGLLDGLPEVDRVWPLEPRRGAMLELMSALRRRHYAWAVDFFGNPRSALIARLSGASRRAGYDLRGRGRSYTVRVPRSADPAPGRRERVADAHVRLARAAGGVPDGGGPRVALHVDAMEAARVLLIEAGIERPGATIGLVAAGSWPTKTWPLAYAARLAQGLLADGHEVLLLAGPAEAHVAETLRLLAPGIAVLPACDVPVLVAVVAGLRAVVGNDSGPRHIAAAFGVPTFAWFGPTHPDTWTTPGAIHDAWWTRVPCRACDRTVCPHWNCLPGLSPDVALARVRAHLGAHAPLRSATGRMEDGDGAAAGLRARAGA